MELIHVNNIVVLLKEHDLFADAVDHATKKFSLTGQTGLVVGSRRPWAELISIKNGAKKIVTAEYFNINITDERFEHIHPDQLMLNWQRFAKYILFVFDICFSYSFDFVISYSSLEHSGLGRYDDPIDPIGDLREMLKIGCLIKRGGLLFLGLPTGQDKIVFNLHRVYGVMRLSMMFTGILDLHLKYDE